MPIKVESKCPDCNKVETVTLYTFLEMSEMFFGGLLIGILITIIAIYLMLKPMGIFR